MVGAECETTDEWAIPGHMIHDTGNEVTCRFKLYNTTANKFIHTCISVRKKGWSSASEDFRRKRRRRVFGRKAVRSRVACPSSGRTRKPLTVKAPRVQPAIYIHGERYVRDDASREPRACTSRPRLSVDATPAGVHRFFSVSGGAGGRGLSLCEDDRDPRDGPMWRDLRPPSTTRAI